jgi:chitinase
MIKTIKFCVLCLLLFLISGCVTPQPTPDDNKPTEKANITFNTNGGVEIEPMTGLTAGDKVKLPEPTKEGNMFIGWYDNEDFDGKSYEGSYTYKEDVTLYACWMTLQYKIYFHSDEVELTTLNQTYKYGDELDLPLPTSSVYDFAGWYLDGEKFTETTMPAKEITLKAKWEPKKFTVTLDLNGGELLEGSNILENVAGGSTLALPVPNKTGYVFIGWYTSLDNRGLKFTENDVITESITLYAKYESLGNLESEYEINYELNDGNFEGNYPEVYEVGKVTVLANPVKSGYNFEGWYESPLFIGERVTEISANQIGEITLYAKWMEVKDTYQVKFINHLKQETIVDVPSGQKVKAIDAGSYQGETLIWYQGNKAFNFETPIYEDITLYANWAQLETVILTMINDVAFDNIELLSKVNVSGKTFNILWSSSDPYTMSNKGVTNPARVDTEITLTAKFSYNGSTIEQPFKVIVPRIVFDSLSDVKPVFAYVYSTSYKGFTDTARETLDVVNISFGRVSDDGVVDLSELKNIEDIMQIRKTGTRVVLCIGGYGSSCKQFSDAAYTAAGRTKLAQSILEAVERYHFDGVDIDWEYPGYETGRDVTVDRPNFTAMMAQIANTLKNVNPDYLVTSAVPGGPWGVDRYDVSTLNDILDYIHLMTYDFHGSSKAVHHTALYSSSNTSSGCSVADTIRVYKERGASTEKLVVGVAFYGRVYTLGGAATTDKGVGSTNVIESGKHITYTDIIKKYYNDPVVKNRMIYYYDTKSCAPSIYDPATNTVISFDDPNSIDAKCQYVWNYDLAGLMYWENGEDTTDILLKAINKGMK